MLDENLLRFFRVKYFVTRFTFRIFVSFMNGFDPFYHSQNLNKHCYTIHKGHKDYECKSWSKSFSKAVDLKRHIHQVHEGQKSFSPTGNLKKHMKSHIGQKDYK